jgi:hypothetical protein
MSVMDFMRCSFVTDKDHLIHLSGSLINDQNDQGTKSSTEPSELNRYVKRPKASLPDVEEDLPDDGSIIKF